MLPGVCAMPEGDTVYRVANRMNEVLAGRELTGFELRVPKYATSDLTGEIVHRVRPYGKHILHEIGDFTLRSHLRMDGSWQLYRPSDRWRKPAHTARAILRTERADAVGFEISMIDLVPTTHELDLVGHLGPDPLQPDFTDDDFETAARNLANDTREIHVALLDQRNVAGFGNEYAAELLFLRGVDPRTPANEVDVEALLRLGIRTIRANLDRPDRTFTGSTRPGQTDWVYGRANRACRRCGGSIKTFELGAKDTEVRIVFWCPQCQR